MQSGNSELLDKMNRGYTREYYLDRIAAIRRIIPGCTISTDIITGFCGETDQQHQETISLMEEVKYNLSYMYYYVNMYMKSTQSIRTGVFINMSNEPRPSYLTLFLIISYKHK